MEMQDQRHEAADWFRSLRDRIVAAFEGLEDRGPGTAPAGRFEVKPTQRPMFGPIETSDGYVMVAIASEKTFQSLMQVIGDKFSTPETVTEPKK